MGLGKLTLFRNLDTNSEKISQELKRRDIKFIEVFSNSERKMPLLVSSESAYSFRGYNSIIEYINHLYPTKQNS